MSNYRGYRVEVEAVGVDACRRIEWVVFCDASVWSTGVLMDGAVYIDQANIAAATAEATRRAHKLVDDYLDRQVDPRRSERQCMEDRR